MNSLRVAFSVRMLLVMAVLFGATSSQTLTPGTMHRRGASASPQQSAIGGSGPALVGAPGGSNLQSVFEQLQARQFAVRLTGIRRVHFYKEGRLFQQIREGITILPATATTEMQFKLELLSVDMPRPDPRELAIAVERYRGHSGFLFLDRDFHVHDARLAQLNYQVSSSLRLVAGRQVLVHSITPRMPERSSYEVQVDVMHGIVVRTKEFNAFGVLVFDTDYESYQLAENAVVQPSFQAWQPLHQVQTFPDVAAATEALQGAFVPRIPRATALPAGYTLSQVRITAVDEGGGIFRRYLVLEYTDGIDCLFLVESAALAQASESAVSFDGVHQCVQGAHCQSWAWKSGVQFLVVARALGSQVPNLLKQTLRG